MKQILVVEGENITNGLNPNVILLLAEIHKKEKVDQVVFLQSIKDLYTKLRKDDHAITAIIITTKTNESEIREQIAKYEPNTEPYFSDFLEEYDYENTNTKKKTA